MFTVSMPSDSIRWRISIFSAMLGSCTDGFCRPSRRVSSLSITRRPVGISAPVYVFQSWMSSCFIFRWRLLITQRVAVRGLLKIGFGDLLAKFATVDFSLLADQGFDFLRVVVPALQVSAAEFAFRVFFIAGALCGFLRLDFGCCRRFGFGRNGGRG